MSLPLLVTALVGGPDQPARGSSPPPVRAWTGPDTTVLDLIRPAPGANRIFVQASFPGGGSGVFLVDTGADVTVLSTGAAERLGITADREVRVWGLSGSATVGATVLDGLKLGDVTVSGLDVVIGAPGLQSMVGFMPVDGLIGNNVWGNFTVEIDYPTDRMVLYAPDKRAPRRKSSPMFFDGSHVHAPIGLTTPEPDRRTELVITQVDTGASDLTLCAATGLPFLGAHTQGLETVRGIGASETLPPYRFLEMTRRIPLDAVEFGGRTLELGQPARWVAYEDTQSNTCDGTNTGMRALVGHEYLAEHRVIFDYQGGRLALLKSRGKPRQLDAHAVLLEQEIAANGDAVERALARGKLRLGTGDDEGGLKELERFVSLPNQPDHAEAVVLLAQVLHHQGKHDDAWRVLAELTAGDLVDQEQIVGTVNGLLFEGDDAAALALAQRGAEERPDDGWAQVALADVHVFQDQLDLAQEALLVAARFEQYPDAHLLRRARVALAAGDRYGSMAHVRKLLKLYPGGGPYLWFYAMLVEGDDDAATFRADIEEAMDRLHPSNRPYDFLVGAYAILGDTPVVERYLALGLDAHCGQLPASPELDNCLAWYWGLAGIRPDDALARIDGALAQTGPRSDFLDTKAMVHLGRGELDEALTSAWGAATLAPDDVYMLWQAERIRDLVQARDESAARASGTE